METLEIKVQLNTVNRHYHINYNFTVYMISCFSVQGCVGPKILKYIGGSVLNNISKKSSPRFIKSHLPKDLLPTGIWEKKSKVK